MGELPVAIVTGAGSGVGRAIAVALSKSGHRVVLVGRRFSALQETEKLLDTQSICIAGDVSIGSDRARMIEQTIEGFGRIDVLVNNAGAAELVKLADATTAQIEHAFAVNAVGPVDLTARVLSTMSKQSSGCIVSISSYSTLDPFAGLGMYGCSKGALNVLCKAVVNEYGDVGIRAYTIALGAAETGMLRSMFDTEILPESATVTPEQVAECVLGLVGDTDAERNGQVVCFPPMDEA